MVGTIPGAVGKYVQEALGGPCEARPTVTTAALLETVLINNDDRVAFIVVNLTTSDIYLAPRRYPGADRGLLLQANGGLVAFSVRDDFVMPALQWHINNIAYPAGDVLVIQVIRVRV